VHELSLASAVVETVERHAGGQPVEAIWLQVGALRQVVAGSLELYVEIVGRGTVCEGARLEIDLVSACVACCGEEWEPPSFRCPCCGGAAEVVAGNEFMVDSIELKERACIAPM
jgi:hydrogenase nickel incorporation protein HypA/HybF